MEIHGVTPSDCRILDHLWSLETEEQIHRYYQAQSPAVQRRIDVLVELLHLSAVDEQVEEQADHTTAQSMLHAIGISTR